MCTNVHEGLRIIRSDLREKLPACNADACRQTDFFAHDTASVSRISKSFIQILRRERDIRFVRRETIKSRSFSSEEKLRDTVRNQAEQRSTPGKAHAHDITGVSRKSVDIKMKYHCSVFSLGRA
jgi:hypothetical protein